ncbi:MAG: ABC transporter substrate-binding protein [Parcubacteria group bacterium]
MSYSSIKALLLKRFHLPKERSVRRAVRSFSLAEKTVFYVFVLLFIFSGTALIWKVNSSFLVEVPSRGGTLVEGIVGNPRFINPTLALSEADKSLSALIYSGLISKNHLGEIENNLAEEISTESNGLTYTARLKEGVKFHDGVEITADDIIFTIQKIQDPNIKSPLFGDWSGVAVEKIDERTVRFSLKQPYAPFLNNLSLGILPRHIWRNVRTDEFAFSQFNTLPVGSGPYKINNVERNSGGIPDYYDLVPNNEAPRIPYISHIIFKFYASEKDLLEAFRKGDIDSLSGIASDQAELLKKSGAQIHSSPLPRVFGVFFNQNQNKVLLDKTVRSALNISAPKEEIVETVLHGFGTVIDGPLPPGTLGEEVVSSLARESRLESAAALLSKSGWARNPQTGVLEKKSGKVIVTLSFSISTGNVPELRAVAEKLRDTWTALGAQVEVQVYETGELNQTVIRPRKFDALLFGEVVGRDADLYPFWHSSQRIDPGLNIALYANSRADKFLEDVRKTTDPALRRSSYTAFQQEIKNDVPAVFLYAPNFIYVLPEKVKGVDLGELSTSQDRFAGVLDWYIDTDSVWKIFNK